MEGSFLCRVRFSVPSPGGSKTKSGLETPLSHGGVSAGHGAGPVFHSSSFFDVIHSSMPVRRGAEARGSLT